MNRREAIGAMASSPMLADDELDIIRVAIRFEDENIPCRTWSEKTELAETVWSLFDRGYLECYPNGGPAEDGCSYMKATAKGRAAVKAGLSPVR